ncbi:hypothetical protein Tco_0707805 [Tanacetum coccineum]
MDCSMIKSGDLIIIKKIEMICNLFGEDEEYVAIKEHECDDLTSTNEDACHTYQEIFRRMDERWMDLAGKEIDEVGSGVADECTYLPGVVSSSICSSSRIDETNGLSLISVVVQAVYSAEAAVLEELGAAVLMDMLVEEEEVVDEEETHVVFLVNPISFSSFFML